MIRLQVAPYRQFKGAGDVFRVLSGCAIGLYVGAFSTLALTEAAIHGSDGISPVTFSFSPAVAWWVSAFAAFLPTRRQVWVTAVCSSGLAGVIFVLPEVLSAWTLGGQCFLIGSSVLFSETYGWGGVMFTNGIRLGGGAVFTFAAKINLAQLAGSGPRRRLTERAARQLTGFALAIGGPKRAWRAEEFLADLSRSAVDNDSPAAWAQLSYASGLIRGSLRLRAGDAIKPLAYWMLAKPRTERIVATLTVMTAIYFWSASGFSGLMQQLVNVAAVASIIAPALWLRKEHGIPDVQRRTENVAAATDAEDPDTQCCGVDPRSRDTTLSQDCSRDLSRQDCRADTSRSEQPRRASNDRQGGQQ